MSVKKAIAIDAQLLVLLVVGLTDVRYIDRHKRTARVYNSKSFVLIRDLVVRAPRIIVTAHILTEASNHLRQAADPMRSEIMLTFRALIDRAEETAVSGRIAAASPNFIRLGLTDTAISSLDPAEKELLTVDHDLHVACARSGFDVVNLTSYLYE